MCSTRHISVFIVLLVFAALAIQPTIFAQDTSASIQDEHKALGFLEESQSQEEPLLEVLSQPPTEPQISWLQVLTLIVTFLIAIGGWVVAIGSWVFAAYQESKNRKEAERSRLEEHLFRSLDFFSGRTQRRSIGIAVVKANWEQFPELRPTWVSLLVSQAIYLLTESEQHYKAHELQNLKDIVKILVKSKSDLRPDDRVDLREAIKKNRKNEERKDPKGVIVEPEDLHNWKEEFL